MVENRLNSRQVSELFRIILVFSFRIGVFLVFCDVCLVRIGRESPNDKLSKVI